MVANATKWSALTEVIAKLISPITNMVLARILVPADFGIVATITMVVSFADIFSDAGFQKYLIQHQFQNREEMEDSINVAFWTNLVISIVLWLVISIFSEAITALVGTPGVECAIIVACVSLPLTAFYSIQMAIFKRNFDYKMLFYIRFVGILIPFIITVPLALVIKGYWALIIGTIAGNLANTIILVRMSRWKPNLIYKVCILKKMISFSMWTLIETIVVWLTSYIDMFIIGSFLNSYYLGIYKTSMTTVNQIMALVTGPTMSVLFSALSRLQDDSIEFQIMFYRFQRFVGLLVLPMGVGIFVYKDLVTKILLGNQWSEAAGFIGIWGIVGAIYIVFGAYSSEVYRAKGKPKISVIAQTLYIIMLIPTLLISINKGFTLLYYIRTLTRFLFIIIHMIIMKFILKMSPLKMFLNVLPSIISSAIMGGVAYLLKLVSDKITWSLFSVIVCIITYFIIIMLFPSVRYELVQLLYPKYKLLLNKIK